MTITQTNNKLNTVRIDALDHLTREQRVDLGVKVLSFLDSGATATDRATAYNTLDEQREAVEKIHRDLAAIDRGVYTLMLCMPITDYSAKLGLGFLLDNPHDGTGILDEAQEAKAVRYIVRRMTKTAPHRMIKAFLEYKTGRVATTRTRKIILNTVLNARNLELWSVKYRAKLKLVLEHAFRIRMAGILRSVLSKQGSSRTAKESGIVRDQIMRHVDAYDNEQDHADVRRKVEQCVGFILGADRQYTLPLLKAHQDAKTDLEAGKRLPPEILEGIRNRYHADVPHARVLELTAKTMTAGQKMRKQAEAAKAGVTVDFDPSKISDMLKLYAYAYERGMDPAVKERIEQVAERTAKSLHISYRDISVVLDASGSMFGHRTQKLHPMICAQAALDVLAKASDRCTVHVCGGYVDRDSGLVRPKGDTDLARALVRAIQDKPDVVLIFSDGYENAPAGRVAETMQAIRGMGIDTPVYQINPVLAAESGAVRRLSPDVPPLPLADPKQLPLAMVRAALEADVKRGIEGLARMALPNLGLQLDMSEEDESDGDNS